VPSEHGPGAGELTVLVEPVGCSAEQCATALLAQDIAAEVVVDPVPHSGDLVLALFRTSDLPRTDDFDVAARTVGAALSRAGITFEVRGTGFQAVSRTGDRSTARTR
jgi:hypothetical protein